LLPGNEEYIVKNPSIIIKAEWDEEAQVWIASSNDIDGLALEAVTMEILLQRIPGALCDLLELNGFENGSGLPEIPYHVMSSTVGRIPNPCSQ